MVRRIENEVARNRQSRRRLDGYQISLDTAAPREFGFSGNTISIDVSGRIETRGFGDGFVMGHPNPEHGIGRGTIGDQREEWATALTGGVGDQPIDSVAFTDAGRQAVIGALAADGEQGSGPANRLNTISIGTGQSPAGPSDTDLDVRTAQSAAIALAGRPDTPDPAKIARAQGWFGFAEHGPTIGEFAVSNPAAEALARIVTDEPLDLTLEQEARVAISMAVSGHGAGVAVITTRGEQAIAEAIRRQSGVGINEIQVGYGDRIPSKADTELDAGIATNQNGRKRVQREVSRGLLRSRARYYTTEPSNQPITIEEMGLFDLSGRLVYRAVIDPFEKTDQFPFTVSVDLQVL